MAKRSRHLRSRAAAALLAAVAFPIAPAAAQSELDSHRLSGELLFGGRVVWGDENAAKFQEYRDIEDGPFGAFDLHIENEEITRWLRLRGDNVGYDDQRYLLEGGRYGRFSFDLFYGELPHVFSFLSATPYDAIDDSTFVLPSGVQSAITGGATLDEALAGTFHETDLELRWREGRIGGEFHATDSLRLHAGYRIQDKEGRRAFATPFGTPGGTFVTVPVPIDERIHEATIGTDFTTGLGTFSIEYLGNFFENDVDSVISENPLVEAFGEDEALFGRSSAAPDNWMQRIQLAGAGSLPVDVPNHVAATFAYGFRHQDEDFLPHTINPVIQLLPDADLALPRDSLEGQVQTILGNFLLTLRPLERLDTRFRYRIYDYRNMTDEFVLDDHVLNDFELEESPFATAFFDYQRQNADLDLTWRVGGGLDALLGYGWQYWHRSDSRQVEDMHEHGPTAGLTWRNRGNLVQVTYDYRTRDAQDYDPFSYVDATLGPFDPLAPGNPNAAARLTAVFAPLRRFDQADRELHRGNVLARLTPEDRVEVTLTGSVHQADYEVDFGLVESVGWSAGTDVYYQMHPRVGVLAYYSYEWQEFDQDSIYRPRTFAPPIVVTTIPENQWSSESQYRYHNAGVDLRLALIPDLLDANLGYLVNYGEDDTDSSFVPGGAAQGDAEDFPTIDNLLQAVTARLDYHLTDQITLSTGYRFEDYDIDNFRNDLVPEDYVQGSDLYIRDVIEDYEAHVFGMAAQLRF